MLDDFKSHLLSELPFLFKSKIIIATSSGVDSVVLCFLCKRLGLEFSIAHCNFALRGGESDLDAKFSKDFAKSLNVNYYSKTFNTLKYKKENSLSTQMAARELRYTWFDAISINYDYVLTAHHLDDQLETFFINFSRGSGLDGLCGIPAVSDNLVRPLLGFSKDQILNFAKKNNISWREDSSNNTNDYLRNDIRNNIIPRFKKFNPSLLKGFNNTLSSLKGSKSILNNKINEVYEEIITREDYQTKYEINKILELDNLDTYLHAFFYKYGFTNLIDIKNILSSQSGKFVVSKTHRLVKDRGYLILDKVSDLSFDPLYIDSKLSDLNVLYGSLNFNLTDSLDFSNSNSNVFVDEGCLIYPLRVDSYSSGMEFFPLGMKGKKSVSKFLKDEKISLNNKKRVIVLINGNDEIIWIINHRIDDRYKITESSKKILKISFNKF
ncbi:tRNA lysidine(34) synthetase TilS [Flavobacteriaceae bacterium]|nr:tRNA lysidine(34) synthetase TilS [Flavobacteriaceae bacterium]